MRSWGAQEVPRATSEVIAERFSLFVGPARSQVGIRWQHQARLWAANAMLIWQRRRRRRRHDKRALLGVKEQAGRTRSLASCVLQRQQHKRATTPWPIEGTVRWLARWQPAPRICWLRSAGSGGGLVGLARLEPQSCETIRGMSRPRPVKVRRRKRRGRKPTRGGGACSLAHLSVAATR